MSFLFLFFLGSGHAMAKSLSCPVSSIQIPKPGSSVSTHCLGRHGEVGGFSFQVVVKKKQACHVSMPLTHKTVPKCMFLTVQGTERGAFFKLGQ